MQVIYPRVVYNAAAEIVVCVMIPLETVLAETWGVLHKENLGKTYLNIILMLRITTI